MSGCPNEEVLAAFAHDACSPEEAAAVARHVEACQPCSAWLEQARADIDYLAGIRSELGERGSTRAVEADQQPPAVRIPGYRIVRKLGEGGMGIVYEAEQEKPRRMVALKIIRQALPMPRTLQRFEHEVQALGRLQHPGIAQILEAGTFDSEGGPQPFYAMELIRGEPLHDHLRRAGPDLEGRLRLFAGICAAVHHAHQRAVIHRDLKPGNVLVDQAGQPKVLDFGLARLFSEDAPPAATRTGQIPGTVPYMSPEQVRGDPGDLDPRSDVYSLGVILFEMLTDRLPYDLSGKSLGEQARIIAEVEPTPLRALQPRLPADLATVVRKTLEKDRDRRYRSAHDLGEDVRRFLAHQPIAARPPSTFYLVARFSRRNRVLVGGIVAVFAALAAGMVATWMQAQRAEAALVLAEEQLQDARAAQDFLQEVLIQASPLATRGKQEPTIRDVLRTALGRVEALEGRPAVEAAVRHTLGRVLLELGDLKEAQVELERSLLLYEGLPRRDLAQIVYLLTHLSALHRSRGDLQQSAEIAGRAIGMRSALHARHRPILMRTLDTLGVALYRSGKIAESERHYREAIALCEQFEAEAREVNLPAVLDHLAVTLGDLGRDAEAEPMFRDAIARQRSALSESHPWYANTLNHFARFLLERDRHAEAEPVLREELQCNVSRHGEESVQATVSRIQLGCALFGRGAREEGLALVQAALALSRRGLGAHPIVAEMLNDLGSLLVRTGEVAAAENVLREALAMATKSAGPTHAVTNRARRELAAVVLPADPEEAAELLEGAFASALQSQAARRRILGEAAGNLARALRALGRNDDAEARLKSALALFSDPWTAGLPSERAILEAFVALLTALGRPDVESYRTRLAGSR